MKDNWTSIVDALTDRAEDLGWSSHVTAEDSSIEFSQETPAGEDFSFCVSGNTLEEIVAAIRECADDFDMEDHVKMWLDAKDSGMSGVPSVVALVEDAQAIQKMLNTLAWDDELCGNQRGKIMDSFTLRNKIEEAKAEYQKRYNNPDWRWTSEGMSYVIQDYHSSKGSVMDFIEDDWKVCKEYGWMLDEVCMLCNERRFCADVDNLESYIQAVRSDDIEAGVENEFLKLSCEDAIALVEDFYKWRKELLPVVLGIYQND